MEGALVNQNQGHGRPMLIDACGKKDWFGCKVVEYTITQSQ